MRPTVVRPTGVGVAAADLTRALVARDPESSYVLFANSRKDRFPADGWQGPNVRIVDRRIPNRILTTLWAKASWPPMEKLCGPCDVVHAHGPLPLPVTRARTIATVYDLFFYHHPELTDPVATAPLVAGMKKLLPRADRIVTASETVRGQIVADFGIDPARVACIPLGLRPEQLAEADADHRHELRKRLRLPSSFILFVGTLEPRKNAGGLIRAFAELRKQKRHDGTRLLIAGQRGFRYEASEKAIADCNITTEVRILDYLEARDVKALISLSRMVVVPSLDEGFGLPMLEAMAQGTVVAASRRGALPEVAADAALLFDPDDMGQFTDAMAAGLQNDTRRSELVARGRERCKQFTWDAAAERMLSLYAALA